MLKTAEIRQIAGRAGRFGIYDTGYVSAVGEDGLAYIRDHFEEPEPEVTHVSLGFPQVLLDMDEPLDAVLTIWKSVGTEPPFEKISIEEVLFLYEKAYRDRKEIDGFEDKHMLYRMLTCSIDIKNRDIVALWLYYCKTYTADVSLHFPALIMCTDSGLMKYETFYKMLDLYYQFSVRLGKEIDMDRLDREREKTEETIMRYLSKDKRDYIRKCQYCGALLPLDSSSRICENCFRETRGQGPARIKSRGNGRKRKPENGKPDRRPGRNGRGRQTVASPETASLHAASEEAAAQQAEGQNVKRRRRRHRRRRGNGQTGQAAKD